MSVDTLSNELVIEQSSLFRDYLRDEWFRIPQDLAENANLKEINKVASIILSFKPEVDDGRRTDYYIVGVEVFL